MPECLGDSCYVNGGTGIQRNDIGCAGSIVAAKRLPHQFETPCRRIGVKTLHGSCRYTKIVRFDGVLTNFIVFQLDDS